ncbi:hypothetical protein BDR07DRAFT_1491622 [Suillus spraguei]|nr:hypothetical protein BDR07DRAFT_1491622 [Suillus spraguei]
MGSIPADAASTWPLTAPTLWIQTIAYASLSISLLAHSEPYQASSSLGIIIQTDIATARRSNEERADRRSSKASWHFDVVMQSFPVLLQISILLFGIALSGNGN